MICHPLSSPVSKLDRRHIERLRKRENLMKWEGAGGGGGARSYDGEKTRFSINHSLLSEPEPHACDMCPTVYSKRTIVRSSFITIMKIYQSLYSTCMDHYRVEHFFAFFPIITPFKESIVGFILENIEKCIPPTPKGEKDQSEGESPLQKSY
jgi:hypothetical protein